MILNTSSLLKTMGNVSVNLFKLPCLMSGNIKRQIYKWDQEVNSFFGQAASKAPIHFLSMGYFPQGGLWTPGMKFSKGEGAPLPHPHHWPLKPHLFSLSLFLTTGYIYLLSVSKRADSCFPPHGPHGKSFLLCHHPPGPGRT